MNFKRSYLALAVAAALGSSNAFAVVNLEDGDTAITFGSEVVVDDNSPNSNGTIPYDDTGDLDVQHPLGTVLSAGQTYYVRYDLTGAEWGAEAGTLTETGSCSAAPAAAPYHPNGDTTALVFSFEVDALDDCASADTFNLSPSNPALKLNGKGAVSLSYAVYEGQADANNSNPNQHLSKIDDGAYINFDEPFLTAKANPPTASIIDVANGSVTFEDGESTTDTDTTAVCGFTVNMDTGSYLVENNASDQPGQPALTDDAAEIISGAELVVTGDFSAATGTNAVYLLNDDDCANGTSPLTVTDAHYGEVVDDTATFDLGTDVTNSGTPWYVCMDVDGSTEIQPSVYTAEYIPTGKTGTTNYSVNNMNLDKCGEVKRGGSSARVIMGMHPDLGGFFRGLIRVTNPSSIDGMVYITAYNDMGNKGGNTYSFNLPAGASTGMISVADIATATGVTSLNSTTGTDEGTAGGKLNKIRLEIKAEFGKDGTETAVQVRAYTPSLDNVNFSEFQ